MRSIEARRKLGVKFLAYYGTKRRQKIKGEMSLGGFLIDAFKNEMSYMSKKYVYELYQPKTVCDRCFLYLTLEFVGQPWFAFKKIKIKP